MQYLSRRSSCLQTDIQPQTNNAAALKASYIDKEVLENTNKVEPEFINLSNNIKFHRKYLHCKKTSLSKKLLVQ